MATTELMDKVWEAYWQNDVPGTEAALQRVVAVVLREAAKAAVEYDAGLLEYPSDEAENFYDAGQIDASIGISLRIEALSPDLLHTKE